MIASNQRRQVFKQVVVRASVGAVLMSSLAATPVHTPPRADGLTFVYSVTSSSSNKKTKEAMDRVATVRIQDGNVRMDYTLGSPMPGQKGLYMLVLADTKKFAMVNDRDKQVLLMDAATFGTGMGALTNNPLLKLSTKDGSFSYTDLGAGDKILGYNTRHVQLISASTMEMRIVGMTQRTVATDTSDQWIGQGLGFDTKSLLAWSEAFGTGLRASNPDMVRQMDKYQQEYGKGGIALRTVMHSSRSNGKGKVENDVLTMEVTDLKKGPIDASVFAIPAGYKIMDMNNMGDK